MNLLEGKCLVSRLSVVLYVEWGSVWKGVEWWIVLNYFLMLIVLSVFVVMVCCVRMLSGLCGIWMVLILLVSICLVMIVVCSMLL